jgi:hypothetical protein
VAERCGEPARPAPVQQHERQRGTFLRLHHEIPGMRIDGDADGCRDADAAAELVKGARIPQIGRLPDEVDFAERAPAASRSASARAAAKLDPCRKKALRNASITGSHRACAGGIHAPGYRSSTRTAAASLSLLGRMCGEADVGLTLLLFAGRGTARFGLCLQFRNLFAKRCHLVLYSTGSGILV